MSDFKLSRRAVMAGQAALATAAALPMAATAATTDPATTTAAAMPARWETATAKHLQAFVGQRFRVSTEADGEFVLRLKSVEPVHSGPDRPAHLPRPDGVSAIFESPDQDSLVRLGHRVHTVSHPILGKADLFLGPIPTRDAGAMLELVLN